MTLSFLTPWAAVLGLLGAVGLVALVVSERRSRAVCRALGLVPRPVVTALLPGLALVLVSALLALAVAQPVIATVRRGEARKDAEVLIVIDITRSMLARKGPDGRTRIERARSVAKEVRAALPGVPVGVASLTDRVLPHLFPTPNQDVFLATLDRSVGIERPPPDRRGRGRATAIGALRSLGTGGYFTPATRARVAVVLTDGESVPVNVRALGASLAAANVVPVFVHVWDAEERIYDPNGRPVEEYRADPDSTGALRSIANAVGGRIFGEDAGRVARATQDALGQGPMGPGERELQSLELAPYTVLASFIPLIFLVWRRNLSG